MKRPIQESLHRNQQAGSVPAGPKLSIRSAPLGHPTGPKAANLQTYNTLFNGLTPVYKAPNSKNGTAIVGSTKAPLSTAASCPVGTAKGQAPDGICSHNPLNWGLTSRNVKPPSG